MIKIKLNKESWSFDEKNRLGRPGGFGEVFRGKGASGEVAIKRLKLTADVAAHREMTIGASLGDRALKYVVPVLDFGQDAETDRYYLVMPVCEYSLQDVLNTKTQLTWKEARLIALDIFAGLQEVKDLVHRDLKPSNVLWSDGKWQIADFGIAKFVEDSTSLETLRTSLTPLYAAPEQWLGERPTPATDVYAAGCILHAMINGAPPFGGDATQIRDAHLNRLPPSLQGISSRIDGFVQFMLRKSMSSRPSLDRCFKVISAEGEIEKRPKHSALAAVGTKIAMEQAEAEAKEKERVAAVKARVQLANEANRELINILGRLFSEIEETAEAASREGRVIVLGGASLGYETPIQIVDHGSLMVDALQTGWDPVCMSILTLRSQLERMRPADRNYYEFATTLIFAKTSKDDEYRWREISFFRWSGNIAMEDQPIALPPSSPEFWLAMGRSGSGWGIAHGPWAVDGEEEEAFRERWLSLFAKAAHRKLRPPSAMPLAANFFES